MTTPISSTPRFTFGDERDWFFKARFGMFIHWGLYAIPAEQEQVWLRKNWNADDYIQLIDQFNPKHFNPDHWLDLAQQAGMDYLTFTTKHLDGFCLWDSPDTRFNTMHTPYGRDVLRQLSEACHARNFPLCLYYSVIDWHQKNYPNSGCGHELQGPKVGDDPNLDFYLKYLRTQIRQLCTDYGKIHGFWWDGNDIKHIDPSFNRLIHELQPGAVINNRGFDEGDFGTPERDWDTGAQQARCYHTPTEACNSVGMHSWGYRSNEDFFSDLYLQQAIASTLAKGGNYLLNIGPDAEGRIPENQAAILKRIGQWFSKVKEALVKTDPVSELIANPDILVTQRNESIYVVLHKQPAGQMVVLRSIKTLPRAATLLNTGQSIRASIQWLPNQDPAPKADCLALHDLPINELAGEVMVVKLTFDQPLDLSQRAKYTGMFGMGVSL